MCYAIPAKLVALEKNTAVLDYFGEKRRVLSTLIPVRVGDYVYAQGGIIVNKISPSQAEKINNLWKDIFFSLKKKDAQKAKLKKYSASQKVLKILDKVNRGGSLSRDEVLFLLRLKDKKDLSLLFATANNIRQKVKGNSTCVHGIIEFSNFCRQSCLYCGIRKPNHIFRYRLSEDEIFKIATFAVEKLQFKALLLQSGEDTYFDEEKLIKIVKRIKDLGVLVILSIGERRKSLYKKLFSYGARAAFLRFETAQPYLYSFLRRGKDLKKRLGLLKYLRELGYLTISGFIVGFKGEKNETVADNIFLLSSLNPDMYSFGPYILPQKGILERANIKLEDVLKITAILRLLRKDANILVTTATEVLDKEARRKALLAGANSLMINLTPPQYRNLYQIYPRETSFKGQNIEDTVKEVKELLFSLGRAPSDFGLN